MRVSVGESEGGGGGQRTVFRSQSFAPMASFQEMPRISKQSQTRDRSNFYVIFIFLRSPWRKAYLFCTKTALNHTEIQGVMCHVDMCWRHCPVLVSV